MRSRRSHALAVAALLALFAVAAFLSSREDSATFDETAHIAAGYSALDARDFRLNPEHPPLAKVWCAIPLLFDRELAADYASASWRGTPDPRGAPYRTGADQWTFGFELMNGRGDTPHRRDPARVLVPARSMMIALGVALGLIVYAWSRDLWGPAAGLLSLFIFTLSPPLLAHARLVTTDLPAALGFTSTLWLLWRYTQRPGPGRGLLFAAAVAISQIAKFSLLILWPIAACMTIAWIFAAPPGDGGRRARALRATGLFAAALALAFAAIWAAYGFRFAAAADPEYRLDWADAENGLLRPPGLAGAASDRRLLPEAYLYGLHAFLGTTEKRVGYLNGAVSVDGWWYYFPEAFLLKTPPAFLLLLGALGATAILTRRLRSPKLWALGAPVAVYSGMAMNSAVDIGHRHLLPIYPILIVAAGAAAPLAVTAGRRRALAAFLGGTIVSFVAATPGYLSYFNVLAGGPRGGWRYLLDSNIDWGQDLARLKTAMDAHGIQEVYLAYFGTADPASYGIRFHKVRFPYDFYPDLAPTRPGPGQYLAVSLNVLSGLYVDDVTDFANSVLRRGWVPRERLAAWRAVRGRALARREPYAPLPDWLVGNGAITEAQRREATAGLLSTWLTRVRESMQPIARAGDSIYIYRIESAPAGGV
ncbi:MAG: hypothetical protein HY049_13710 [Acidobacteria bacterium]|nr:hypothetical protein [Acidobacteriota bacterium]